MGMSNVRVGSGEWGVGSGKWEVGSGEPEAEKLTRKLLAPLVWLATLFGQGLK